MYTTKPIKADRDLMQSLTASFVREPACVPIACEVLGTRYAGIPGKATQAARFLDSNLIERTFTGNYPGTDLTVTAVCREYLDYPVVEWTAYVKNTGSESSPVISELTGIDAELLGKNPVLTVSTGDTCDIDLYEETRIALSEAKKYSQKPDGGRGSDCAWPYSRVLCEENGYILSIGWPGQWVSRYTLTEKGFRFFAKQEDTHFYLKPGETVRTPRMTILTFTGGEERSINLWRRFMRDHIIPKPNGTIIEPAISVSDNADGVEFELTTEKQQLSALETIEKHNLPFDTWWIDAGWYDCRSTGEPNDWHWTGKWESDPERFPEGHKNIGEKCREMGLKLLMWFEPERVSLKHVGNYIPDRFLIKLKDESVLDSIRLVGSCRKLVDNMGLLNLGNPECCDWLIDLIDSRIKEYGIKVYRQDFNFPPLSWWRQNDTEDRRGITENLYNQGYLRFWDEIMLRNPGVWINSVSSGGRRSDLESLSRSASIHQSDFGHGEHPQLQVIQTVSAMWQPYFGAISMSWDDENGSYADRTRAAHNRFDNYMAHNSMAPTFRLSVGSLGLYETSDSDTEEMAYYRRFRPIWKRAVPYLLNGDLYVLHLSDRTGTGYHAVQYHDEKTNAGYVQVIRNIHCENDSITVFPEQVDIEKNYLLESPEFGKSFSVPGKELLEKGFTVSLPRRSGEIWFYRAI